MKLLPEHNEALKYCKNVLRKVLGDSIKCMVLFGSTMYPGRFRDGLSDLDVITFSEMAAPKKICELKNLITQEIDFSDSGKPPVVIMDQIGCRLEFILVYQEIDVDCTIMQYLVKDKSQLLDNSARDATDVLIGAVVEHGFVLDGKMKNLTEVDFQMLPYYDDDLRNQRLIFLEQYLKSKLKSIEMMLENNNPEVVDYYFRYRATFLKWLFCYFRKYPVSLNKHLLFQLEKISEISPEEKEIILLLSGNSIQESISNFVVLYKKYYGLRLKETNA